MAESRQGHWDGVYTTTADTEVSWYQEMPAPSLALIEAAGIASGSTIIDVGGGASRLVDCLLDRGFTDLSVLDLSLKNFTLSRTRLGRRGDHVRWLHEDITLWNPKEDIRPVA